MKYYGIDESGNVTEADASTGQPIEVAVDLDKGLSPYQVKNGLSAVADYINRNSAAPVPPVPAAEPKT